MWPAASERVSSQHQLNRNNSVEFARPRREMRAIFPANGFKLN